LGQVEKDRQLQGRMMSSLEGPDGGGELSSSGSFAPLRMTAGTSNCKTTAATAKK
jgi:hypothetical protein